MIRPFWPVNAFLKDPQQVALQNADPLERAEIRRRWKPFMDQLPQFAYLCEEILPEKD